MRARVPFLTAALFGVVLGAFFVDASFANPPEPREADKSVRRAPRELPDDPPGKPAPRPLGVAPAAPVAYGSFISRQVNVTAGGANIVGDAANEPSIAVDPTNPNRIVIGWRQFDTITSNFRQAGYAYSEDGGRTWTFPGVLDPGVFRSDPVLDYDAVGNFYYNSLKVIGGVYSCQVFKSTDRGQSWSAPVEAFGGDKAWMTIDRSGGIGDGHIYQAWSTAAGCCGDTTFNRSTDGGGSFSYPVRIPDTPIWGTLAVDADGNLYVSGVSPDNDFLFLVAKSTNAEQSGSTPTFVFSSWFIVGGSISFGGGSAVPNPGGLHGQVNVGVDVSSGPNAGNVYVLCSAAPASGDPLDVFFVRSTDGGVTWSPYVRVNDDLLGNNAWQWFGTMSVAPNGRIDVIWNDTRNTLFTRLSELYYTSSTDGGVTWAPNQQISPEWDSHIGWPNQSKIGDYYDMISDDVGAHLAWAATFNGEQDVYYLRIGDYDCNSNGVGDSLDIATGTSYDQNGNDIPDECEGGASGAEDEAVASYRLLQNMPNPFNPSTTIRFEVPPGGGFIKLQVFDVTGRLVRTLLNGYEPGGSRSVVWDGRNQKGTRVASGLYIYRLEAPGFDEVRKMMLLK